MYDNKLRNESSLEINNQILDETEVIRDLGILVDNKLTFKHHINKIVKIGYFKSRQLLRVLKTKSTVLWYKVYKTHVRPHLEFNSQIWNPKNKEYILNIEKIQKYYTRMVFKKCHLPYTPYIERLKAFKLDSLELRRKSSRPKRLQDYQIIVKQMNSKTKNSFINRISNKWNKLPM